MSKNDFQWIQKSGLKATDYSCSYDNKLNFFIHFILSKILNLFNYRHGKA